MAEQNFDFNSRDQLNIFGAYDPNGNSIKDEAGIDTGDKYDAENHLIKRGSTISIGYDCDGNRAWKAVNSAPLYYLLDDKNPSGYVQVIAEYGSSIIYGRVLIRSYCYGHDIISLSTWPAPSGGGGEEESSTSGSSGLEEIGGSNTASSAGGGPPGPPQPTVSYYGLDGQGSVRLLTDSTTTATVTDTYDYDAYGVLLQSTGTTVNPYRYTGQQWDPDLGMYCLRARYYKQGIGRFWSMDGFEGRTFDPTSLHKYLYVGANPANKIDPSGHDGDQPSLMASIAIMARTAATYISRMPTAARAAFAAGGSTLGAFFNQIGRQVEIWGGEVIEMFPKIEAEANAILQGFSRRPDWLLRLGDRFMALEAKYQLPKAGPALTRLGSQLQQYTQWASQGPGREVVVWSLKNPEKAVTAEQKVLEAAGNPQGVRFVYGVQGLFDYLTQWVN